MAERIRKFEWGKTPLGPIEDWPFELGSAVNIMLGAAEAISIYWGPNHILLYNDAWREFIGERHPEALGQPAPEIFPEIWETIGPKFADVLDGSGAAFEREQRLPLRRGGELVDTWFDYSFNPIPMADGSIGGIFNIGTEVTDQIEAEAALRESEEFHRLAAEAGNVGTWSVDLETGSAVLSSRMAELMGYAPDDHEAAPSQPEPGHWQQRVPREAWMASVHPDDRATLNRSIAAAQDRGEPFDLEFRVQHGDETRWLYAMGRVKGKGPGQGPRLRGASVDITRRRELEEALVGASETVRRNIGRELHDVLSSDLAALAIRTDNLAHRLREGDVSSRETSSEMSLSEEMGAALDEIAEGVRAAANQARNLSHVLMPATLQKEPLAVALENLCREQAELGTPGPTFEGDRKEPLPKSKETAMHLYRIAREAIANAQRHAGAEHIWVRLRRENDRLVLTVRDDGEGLPRETGSRNGIGLRTMGHRADLIGATLRIESAEDGGTRVQCALPLSEAESE
jgi:signal transduction histidine kinase